MRRGDTEAVESGEGTWRVQGRWSGSIRLDFVGKKSPRTGKRPQAVYRWESGRNKGVGESPQHALDCLVHCSEMNQILSGKSPRRGQAMTSVPEEVLERPVAPSDAAKSA